MRSPKIGVVVSDSEALRRNRCLGMLGVRSFKIGVVCDSEALLQAVRCLGILGCDRLKLGLCAIAKRCCKQFAVWGCGVRSLKIRVVCDRCLGCWGAIV